MTVRTHRTGAQRTLALICAVFCGACGGGAGSRRLEPSSPAAEGSLDTSPEVVRDEYRSPPASTDVEGGERSLARGDVTGARVAFERALRASERDARAHFDMGLVHELEQRPDLAEESYRKATDAVPTFAEAWNNLGLLLRAKKKLAEATAEFRRAAEFRPSWPDPVVNLALTLEEAGDTQSAATAYARAVRLAPKDALVRTNYGLLLLQIGAKVEATEQFQTALPIAKSRQDRAALAALGNGLRRSGRPDLAERALVAAIQAESGQATPALLAELALSQHAKGDAAAAIATLRQSIALDARYGTGHFLLATILEGRGTAQDAQEALVHYRAYLELEPSGRFAKKARERTRGHSHGSRPSVR